MWIVANPLSFPTMCRFLSALIILLTLFDSNNGQLYSQQRLQPGITYPIESTWPRAENLVGWFSQWIAESDSPIRFTCHAFNVRYVPLCKVDRLVIQDGTGRDQTYCGGRGFSVLSDTNRLTITLITDGHSPGGSFNCTIKREEAPPPSCECGRKNPTRIYGGEQTGINEYPMMAAVIDSEIRHLICGSTIINLRQVLTAAHCVKDRNPNVVGVLVGEHDMTKGYETAAPAVLLRAESFTVHGNYLFNSSDFDIALITVRGMFTFNDVVGPVCLPFWRRDVKFWRDSVEVMGWGADGQVNGPTNVLMKASVGVTTRDECQPSFPSLTDRQMCTREPNRDSCAFDSGGPLLIQSGSTHRIVQVGLISRGGLCGLGEPALNTRVGAFITWILYNTPKGITYCQVE